MAIDKNAGFNSGAAVGVAQVGADFNRFEMTSSPKFKIGHKIEDGDGNVYRYSQVGEDTNRGVVVSQDIAESSVVDTDNVILAPASCVNTSDGTIGSKYIEITLSGKTANQFAGARLILTGDTGEGYTYNIKGNTATGNPASGTIRVSLKEPLQVAVVATTDFAIIGNKYANLHALDATDTAATGVTCATFDVSEASYGWIQTKGIVGVLTSGTTVLGNAVQTNGPGSVGPVTASTSQQVGRCLIVGDASEHSVIDVSFE